MEETLSTMFKDYIGEVMAKTPAAPAVTGGNVYQEGREDILPYLDRMAETLLLPGSGIGGVENLESLIAKAKAGAACVLMLEHYSNLDLTLFSYLLRKTGPAGEDLARSLVAIAGMKLSEENPVVSAFASAYTRLIIYPSRSLHALDPAAQEREIERGKAINRAAMRTLLHIRHKGKVVLVFPSGTRYRPWDPSTKRGVREIDSYLRVFDYFCPVAINGEVLHVRRGDMMEDTVGKDVVWMTAGPVQSCSEFREARRAEAGAAGAEDLKQAAADGIMALLEELHEEGGYNREVILAQPAAAGLGGPFKSRLRPRKSRKPPKEQ